MGDQHVVVVSDQAGEELLRWEGYAENVSDALNLALLEREDQQAREAAENTDGREG